MAQTLTLTPEEIKKQYNKLLAQQHKQKRHADPEYREKVYAYNREYARKRNENPEVKEKHLQRMKEQYEAKKEEICAKRRERYAKQKAEKLAAKNTLA